MCRRYDIAFEEAPTKDSNEKLSFDLIADPDCLIVKADKEKFFKILGGNFNDSIKKSSAIESLNKIPIF